jgi:hypothetical protein
MYVFTSALPWCLSIMCLNKCLHRTIIVAQGFDSFPFWVSCSPFHRAEAMFTCYVIFMHQLFTPYYRLASNPGESGSHIIHEFTHIMDIVVFLATLSLNTVRHRLKLVFDPIEGTEKGSVWDQTRGNRNSEPEQANMFRGSLWITTTVPF